MTSPHTSPASTDFPGAQWWRVDFHAHTPHSTDAYQKASITDREWLLEHMRRGIDAVCITDHNGGKHIDRLKAEYARMEGEFEILGRMDEMDDFRKLTLFPGVEITTADDIHLLAVFRPEAGSGEISALLGAVGLNDGLEGDAGVQLPQNLLVMLANITPGFDCVLIPAHINGSKGLLRTANPRSKEKVLKHPSIYALECAWNKNPDWEGETKIVEDKSRKAFSIVYGSDSHERDQIGRRSTWVRMETPTLDALRIALMDGGGSAVAFEDVNPPPGPPTDQWLRELSLSGTKFLGRTEPLVLRFNPGLNTVIGGRGSGKSTLVELIRKAAHRSEDLGSIRESELRQQHEGLVTDALKGLPDARVTLVYEKHGHQSRMELTGGENPGAARLMEKTISGEWQARDLPHAEWRGRYPLRIYSQKELYSFRKGPEKLLREIDADPAVDFPQWSFTQQSLVSGLLQTAAKISELSSEADRAPGLMARREDLHRQIHLLEESGHREILQNYNLRRKQASEIKRWEDSLAGLTEELRSLAEQFDLSSAGVTLTRLPESTGDQKEIFLEAEALVFAQWHSTVGENLSKIAADMKQAKEAWESAKQASAWRAAADQAKSAYEALAARLPPEQAANPAVYGQLVQQLNSVDGELNNLASRKNQLVELEAQKAALLAKLEAHRMELSKARTQFLQNLFVSRRDLKITLRQFGDSDGALSSLREVLQRTDEDFSEIDRMMEKLYGDGMEVNLERIRDLKRALKAAPGVGERHDGFEGIPIGKSLCGHLARRTTEDWARLDVWFPPDSLKIQISRDGTSRPDVDLIRASPGQVATAVLAFLLAYGGQPLILDQPEDDLDNQMIYTVIVKELRRNKRNRQVILVTHNANLVVNGNADMIFPLVTSEGRTQLEHPGTLQAPEVRDAVCRIMEGGEQALEQRFRRMVSTRPHPQSSTYV
ncbi:MAG: hypothetical protein V4726_18705 [Verrucomicrobiota bacterium]